MTDRFQKSNAEFAAIRRGQTYEPPKPKAKAKPKVKAEPKPKAPRSASYWRLHDEAERERAYNEAREEAKHTTGPPRKDW